MSLIRSQRTTKQRGVGLIEVLIAMLVFTLGVLGMASMQIKAKRTSYDALQRSMATTLAHDIIERMRSNPSATSLNAYVVDDLGGGSKATPGVNCSTNTCTPAQLATFDIWDWEKALDGASETADGNNAGGLVSPRACITHAAGVVTVAIAWKGYGGLVNPGGSTCGEGNGLYGTGEIERQLVVVSTFIQQV